MNDSYEKTMMEWQSFSLAFLKFYNVRERSKGHAVKRGSKIKK